MTKVKQFITGSVTALAMVVSTTPAMAAHDNDGIGASEVIAGAVILGGLAAILTSSNNDRYDRNGHYSPSDRYGRYDRDYDRGHRYDGSRMAVNKCVRAAEQEASFRRFRANVTEIKDIDRTRDGYRVKGRIVVDGPRHAYDKGRFTCYVDHGRVADVRLSGIGNWR